MHYVISICYRRLQDNLWLPGIGRITLYLLKDGVRDVIEHNTSPAPEAETLREGPG